MNINEALSLLLAQTTDTGRLVVVDKINKAFTDGIDNPRYAEAMLAVSKGVPQSKAATAAGIAPQNLNRYIYNRLRRYLK